MFHSSLRNQLNIFGKTLARAIQSEVQKNVTQVTRRQLSTIKQDERKKKLSDRVAIVTGSTEGIGFAIAKRMADDGANVVICSRKKEKVESALKELRSIYPDQIDGTVCHVGKEEDRENLIQLTLKRFGSIDYLISNVAVNPYFGSFLDMQDSQWDKIFEINLKSPFQLTQKVVPHMINNKRPNENGAIVYVSSIAGYRGFGSIGAYSVSKTALIGLCKNMSMELGVEGIRVNSVAPGVIKTKFSELLWKEDGQDDFYKAETHLKRLGESEEIGGIVSFLCSKDASYITGENVVVAGGFHCTL